MMLLSSGVGERQLAIVLGRFAQHGDVPDRTERPAVRLRLALVDEQVTLALAEPHGPGGARRSELSVRSGSPMSLLGRGDVPGCRPVAVPVEREWALGHS